MRLRKRSRIRKHRVAKLFQPTPLIYQRNKLFCFLGVISKFILILLRKISIERRNDIEDEIHRHYQWYDQHAKAMSYHSKSREENDISEIVDMHRQAKQSLCIKSSSVFLF